MSEASQRHPAGDSHNFGRRVTVGETRVKKPRTVLWEWLLLSSQSPLRRLLHEVTSGSSLEGAFDFLPDLTFWDIHALEGGEVERVRLEPLTALAPDERRALAAIVGRALALFSWLGVSDLHWENLALGRNEHGNMVFAPLDVEMILADLSLPTETKLLPDADPEVAAICRHACGVRRVLPYLGKPIQVADLVAMAGAYEVTLALLDRHAAAIAKVFSDLPGLRETPIRVTLRGTDEYVAPSQSLWPPLLGAESEQLARGDIPYFFRLYGQRGLHYFGNAALSERKTLPLHGDVPKLDPELSLRRGLRSPTRQKLREEGLFTLLGAFDHPSFKGRHEGADLTVTFQGKTLIVELGDGDELESRRNLGAFVASVYLPCQCGEVSTVFVPSVTRCDAPQG